MTQPPEPSRRFWICAWIFEVTAAATALWVFGPSLNGWSTAAVFTVYAAIATAGLFSWVDRPEHRDWREFTRNMPLVHSVLFALAVVIFL